MTGVIDWAASRARMVLAFVALSIAAGIFAYTGLPKEGEPDIEIPALFVAVPFPGISAEDAERLVIRPMETELSDLDGLDSMTATAREGFAGVALEFEFGWDKTKIIADVRDRMNTAEGKFPDGYESYTLTEINFSQFPILIVTLSGTLPERTLLRTARALQDRLEALDPVLEAGLVGTRDEMLEVVIDPLKLEAYNVTAGELIAAVRNNNQLIAAGEIEAPGGAFSVKIPASFDTPEDVYDLPVKVSGDRVITLGQLAEIRLTFEDRASTARFNGAPSVALQIVKRKGFNLIDTAALVRAEVEAARAEWPAPLQAAIQVDASLDQSRTVDSMVRQLEGSVLTAIALVMIMVLAFLGTRSALLVGFAIPTSFLLCFVLLGTMGVSVSNIVMFGLILAVGMLVDGAIVVVEYADKRIAEGIGPMHAFTEAAKRMFWPVVSSTATTLCAFLPMLLWPGVSGEFMGMLPVTLIFVLSASLVVALVYLPVVGGVAGRFSRVLARASQALRARAPKVVLGAVFLIALGLMALGLMQVINPARLFGAGASGLMPIVAGLVLVALGGVLSSITMGALRPAVRAPVVANPRPSLFGQVVRLLTANPVMPLVTIAAVIGFVIAVFSYYGANNKGVEFFVESEPEQAIVYVRARGNLSLPEKDALVARAEAMAIGHPGVRGVFAFAGDGGLSQNTGGASPPLDTIGQIQLELVPWEERAGIAELDGNVVLDALQQKLATIPGIYAEILEQTDGPGAAKPLNLRLSGGDWEALTEATRLVRARFGETEALRDIEDTLPLPGIDWQIDVDVAAAGRFGADVSSVGAMVQLVTRGLMLDTMRVPSSDDEIEIRVRLPEEARTLDTLDTLRVRTSAGLVPLSHFITRTPVEKLARINRVDGTRYFEVKADVAPGLTRPDGTAITPSERIETLTAWLESAPLPAGVAWAWTGDQEEQAEAGAFLSKAFGAALGLMFIILLAQFNSFYNATLVLLAVVLSSTGVLIGMLVMGQSFSIIMTGTGIVALAGIVVNNNIVLIDTFQEYARYMPRIEAIARTAEARIRPVLLTTVTTMAGLSSMMLGISVDFFAGGYTIDSPTALWWKQLATAVVFGLGAATILTLLVTPALLALREWARAGAYRSFAALRVLVAGPESAAARAQALARMAAHTAPPVILWEEAPPALQAAPLRENPLRAAE